VSTVLFVAFGIFILAAMPIGFALALAGTVAIMVAGHVPLTLIPQRMFTAVDSFPFLAIPFFVLTGELMSGGGVTRRLIDFAASVVGAIHGGLAIITQIAGAMMDAMSGSSAASTAAMGSVMLPEMIRAKYERAWAGIVVAASGVTGVIIPPSITFVVFGSVANISIAQLFIGGIVPGVIIVGSLCLLFYVQARLRGYPVSEGGITLPRIGAAFRRAVLALMIPVIVLGGIYGGIFTPTEAGAVAAVYTFVIAVIVYRELDLAGLWRVLIKSSITTAAIMIVVAGANILGWIVTFEQVPQAMARFMLSYADSQALILLALNLLFLLAGMFINASAAVVILVPIVMPVVLLAEIDPVFFGILAVVNLGIGTVTPPLGINLFIVSGIANIPMDRLIRELGPVMLVLLLDLLVFMFNPGLLLWLPNTYRG
jgi:C4-dicarboxylate transporter, DctM subunit